MIKVLIATSETQGARENDYNWCVEGELVWLAPVCARDREDPDGGCGCARGFAGLNSHRATTTAMVRTIEGLTHEDYVEALRSSMDQQGYEPGSAAQIADILIDLVSEWPDGTVVEHRLDYIQTRERIP